MMKKMLIVVILLCGFFGTDIVSNFLDSFSLNATRAYSTTARLYAIDFYCSAFLKNPLFGIGFADGTVNAAVVHGDGRANVSDVGIFAQIAKYGIFILPVYILPLIHSGKRIAIIWKMNYVENRQLYLSLFMQELGYVEVVRNLDEKEVVETQMHVLKAKKGKLHSSIRYRVFTKAIDYIFAHNLCNL